MLVVGTRQLGKTEEMIKETHEVNGILVVPDKNTAKSIAKRAKDSGMPLKLVIDIISFTDKEYMLELVETKIITGTERVFIDDMEHCFAMLVFRLNRSREDIAVDEFKNESEINLSLQGASVGPGAGQIKVLTWTDPNYIPNNKKIGLPTKEYEMTVKNIWENKE
jgi:hypothetical protein